MTLLNLSLEEDRSAVERVKKAEETKQLKQYQPTWEEIFVTGYKSHTGKHKKGILQLKNSEPDKQRILEVRQAVESGELSAGVTDRKKFSKSHCLNLYQQLKELRKAAIIEEYIQNIPENYHSIQTEESLYNMIKLAKQENENALDTETTGLHLEKDKVVGMSITLPKADQHYYIPFLHQNFNVGKQLDKAKVMQILQTKLFDRQDLITVMFNAKFDMHQLIKEDLQFKGTVVDALEGMKVLNENEPSYALKNLANKWGKYFGYTDNSMTFEELFSKNPEDFYIHSDYRLCYFYACKDTHLTYLLYKFINEQLEKQPKLKHVFYDIEVPITNISFKMEQNGMPMDLEYAEEYKQQLETEIEELDSKIKEFFGDINWNSPVQVQKKLYEDLKLKPLDDKKGTGADVLKVLAKEVPELQWLLDYRGKTKLLGSFIEPIPQLVWSDGRVHGRFNQGGTKTGRFSSDAPNLQNLPYTARPMFTAEEGKLIIGIDLSQIEPRVLAHMSGDSVMINAYRTGKDLYATVAASIYSKKYGLTYEQCLEADQESYKIVGLSVHPRKLFKTSLLSIMYETSAYSLAAQAGISVNEAEEMILDFHNTFPTAHQYSKDYIEFANTNSYVETMDGRKRRFLGHNKVAKEYHRLHNQITRILGREFSNIFAEKDVPYRLKQQYFPVMKEYNSVVRKVVNARTQGTAADIMKLAMIRFDQYLQTKNSDWKMIGTIHDEVLIEVPQSITAEEFTELEYCMTNCVQLDVPLKVDTEVAIRWSEGVSKAEFLEKGMNCFTEKGWLQK